MHTIFCTDTEPRQTFFVAEGIHASKLRLDHVRSQHSSANALDAGTMPCQRRQRCYKVLCPAFVTWLALAKLVLASFSWFTSHFGRLCAETGSWEQQPTLRRTGNRPLQNCWCGWWAYCLCCCLWTSSLFYLAGPKKQEQQGEDPENLWAGTCRLPQGTPNAQI